MVVLPRVFGIAEVRSKWVYFLCSNCFSTFPRVYTFQLPQCVVRLWSCLGMGPGTFLGERWVTGNKITTQFSANQETSPPSLLLSWWPLQGRNSCWNADFVRHWAKVGGGEEL